MKIIATIPVFGRAELVRWTIERLYNVNNCFHVICSGHEPILKAVCEASGAEWVEMPNKPLGNKWNAAIKAAQKYNPDAVLFVGSSDWLSSNWLEKSEPFLKNYDLIGKKDCYFTQLFENGIIKTINWGGYANGSNREGEPIGIGRLFSARCLDKLNWRPVNPDIENSIDYSTLNNIVSVGGKVLNIEDETMMSLSIGTWKWENKHVFSRESEYPTARKLNYLESETIYKEFPELFKIFNRKV